MLLYKAEVFVFVAPSCASQWSGKRPVPDDLIPRSVVCKVHLNPQQQTAIEDFAAQMEGISLPVRLN
jgi:hypothetical protein